MSTVALHPVRPALQLTRRGRVVVFLAATALVLLAAIFLGAASVATDDAGSVTQTRVIMVDEGDTLWAIASDLADDGKVQQMIDAIKRLNALDSAALQVGQELHVPA
ncbi:LysM peptidoglycan-binding domain-containing protein [Nocardioides daejeonensis]|uniref:LysM peptidoglycan-binding domain-containing protein n=1 Tax=Nocardioides daejeonensis TaxID=1046556 RepID=UPI000D74F9B3|nr:LysM peptidoglycan-binding domain-containing protein [Nocardioides daejeonensis]